MLSRNHAMPQTSVQAHELARSTMDRREFMKVLASAGALLSLPVLSGCVNQSPQAPNAQISTQQTARLIATSPAVADVCDKLELDLVGVCKSTLAPLPDRYASLPEIGPAMSPDLENVRSLKPDYVLSPDTLQSDLQPKYKEIGVAAIFMNMRSVEGMYESMSDVGEKFSRQSQAKKAQDEYQTFIDGYRAQNNGKPAPKCLVLMGLPGSYIVATPHSYVWVASWNLLEENVYSDSDDQFLTINTEDMQKKDPDIILSTAHALPDQVVEMFAKEFSTNDIWKHFRAVQDGRVHDLSYDHFGMSAKFNYPDALKELAPLLFPDS